MGGDVAVGGGDLRGDPAAPFPVGADDEPFGFHDFGEVVADFIGDGFVEDAFAAEGLVVEFEGFEFDAGVAGDVTDGHIAEVGVSGFGADRGEFFGSVFDDEIALGGGVFKTFKE